MTLSSFKEKMNSFADWVYILIISVIYTALSLPYFGATFSEMFIDTGREIYIPFEMVTRRALLYKDILNVYGPLAYQINALLLSIFGLNINVLLAVGFVLGLLVAIILYCICRLYVSKIYSLFVVFCVLLSLLTVRGVYMLPYAFAMAYATAFFYAGLWLTLIFLERNSVKSLNGAFFLFGASLCAKPDYFIAIAFLAIFVIITRKLAFKNILLMTICILVVPVISLFQLIYFGLNLADIKQAFVFSYKVTQAPSLTNFYSNIGVIFHPGYYLAKLLLTAMAGILIAIFLSYLHVLKNILKNAYVYGLFLALAFVIFGLLLTKLSGYPKFTNAFFWISQLTTQLVLMLYIIKRRLSNFTDTESNKTYLLLNTVAVLSMSKGFSLLGSFYYVPFLFPLTVVTALIGFYLYISAKKDSPLSKTFLPVCTIALIFCVNIYAMHFNSRTNSGFLKTEYGQVSTSSFAAHKFNETAEYIKTQTSENSRVLVVPEGPVLNLVSRRPTDNKLFAMMIPPYIESYGEDALLAEMQEKQIPYIVILYRNVEEYLPKDTPRPYFGEAYGQKILEYIDEDYDLVKTVDMENSAEPFARIYKAK